jgi:Secretion system C-terminal sorting domain
MKRLRIILPVVSLLLLLADHPTALHAQVMPEFEWSATLHDEGHWMDLREVFELESGNLLFTGSRYYTDEYGYGHSPYDQRILCWEVTPSGQPIDHNYGNWVWGLRYNDAEISDEDNVLVAGWDEYREYEQEATNTLANWNGQEVNYQWERPGPGDYPYGEARPLLQLMSVSHAVAAVDTFITIWRSQFLGGYYDFDWYTCVEYRTENNSFYRLNVLDEDYPIDTYVDANSQPILIFQEFDSDTDQWYYTFHRYTQSGDVYPLQQFAMPFELDWGTTLLAMSDQSFVLCGIGETDADSTLVARHEDDGTLLWQAAIPGDTDALMQYGPDHILVVFDGEPEATILNFHTGELVTSEPWDYGDLRVRSFSSLSNGDVVVVGGHQYDLPYDQAYWDAEIRYFRNPLVSGSVEEAKNRASLEFQLLATYPNPFNSSTTIQFDLARPSLMDLRVFDLLGREVTVLGSDESYMPGTHRVVWDASGLPGGMYFLRATTEDEQQMRRMVFLK